MTIQDGICDSCGSPSDTLFPVAVLDELPTGGMRHVQKWYCIECKDVLEQEAEENKNKAEDKEDDEEVGHCNPTKISKLAGFGIKDYFGVIW